jgi:hypothetical protein
LINDYGLNTSSFECSNEGIKKLLAECELYNMPRGTCTTNGIDNERLLQMKKSNGEDANRIAQNDIDETKSMLSNILGGSFTGEETFFEKYGWIIVAIVGVVLCSIIVVVFVLVM